MKRLTIIIAFSLTTILSFGQHKIFNTADSLVINNEYNLAIEQYLRYINIDSISHICSAGIGFCYFKKGDTLNAINYLKTSLSLKPDYLEGLYQLGLILQETNKIEEAKLKYLEALDLLKNDISEHEKRNIHAVYNNLGVIYMEVESNPKLAIKMYTEAIKVDTLYSDAIQNRGKAYLMNYQFEEAKNDLEKAKRLNGNLDFINYFLFYTYWNILNHKSAYDLIMTSNLSLSSSVDFRLAGLICYLNSNNNKSFDFFSKIKTEERTNEDYVQLAYLSYLFGNDYCEYIIKINNNNVNTLIKPSLKKYRLLKKKCKNVQSPPADAGAGLFKKYLLVMP